MRAHRLAVVLSALVLGAGIGTGTTLAAGSGQPRQADLKVALFDNGRCGSFSDTLPAVITRPEIKPGDRVSDLTVCITNSGRTDGAVGLSIIERAEDDVTCDGEESVHDPTCGSGQVGELGSSLAQRIGVGACTTPINISAAHDRWLPELETAVALLPRIRPRQVICTRLVLDYSPAAAMEDVVTQSDRTSWRYSFSIIEN